MATSAALETFLKIFRILLPLFLLRKRRTRNLTHFLQNQGPTSHSTSESPISFFIKQTRKYDGLRKAGRDIPAVLSQNKIVTEFFCFPKGKAQGLPSPSRIPNTCLAVSTVDRILCYGAKWDQVLGIFLNCGIILRLKKDNRWSIPTGWRVRGPKTFILLQFPIFF